MTLSKLQKLDDLALRVLGARCLGWTEVLREGPVPEEIEGRTYFFPDKRGRVGRWVPVTGGMDMKGFDPLEDYGDAHLLVAAVPVDKFVAFTVALVKLVLHVETSDQERMHPAIVCELFQRATPRDLTLSALAAMETE